MAERELYEIKKCNHCGKVLSEKERFVFTSLCGVCVGFENVEVLQDGK